MERRREKAMNELFCFGLLSVMMGGLCLSENCLFAKKGTKRMGIGKEKEMG